AGRGDRLAREGAGRLRHAGPRRGLLGAWLARRRAGAQGRCRAGQIRADRGLEIPVLPQCRGDQGRPELCRAPGLGNGRAELCRRPARGRHAGAVDLNSRSISTHRATSPPPTLQPSPAKDRKMPSQSKAGGEAASKLISEKIAELGDWRGDTLARMRTLIREADPDIVEEWKWRGTPVWSHGGGICTGESYKSIVKLTFFKG